MSSTYLSLHYHLVFSTKHRRPYIDPPWRDRLYEYLGGTLKSMGGFPQKIGGTPDHVHILTGLRATHTVADVLRDLKKNSSVWIHTEIGEKGFAWQEGYAAFTVSATSRDGVRRYIEHQEAHHRVKSFEEELRELLEMAGIEYDPRYLD